MAPNADQTPAVDIPEPAAVAESGVTTSEWKLIVGYLIQLAAYGTTDAASQLGLSIPSAVVSQLAQVEVLGLIAVAVYVIGRSVRKLGTSA